MRCPVAGGGSLAALADRGWRVAKQVSVQVSVRVSAGPAPQATERLLLQRYDRASGSNFE
ncbi:MAG: hypothetical protein U1F22_03265 [Lysobacterales bacterium]